MEPAPTKRRVWWRWLLVVVALGVTLAAVAWRTWLRDTTTPITLDEAISDFRADSPTEPSPTSSPRTPEPTPLAAIGATAEAGVYSYATEGTEGVDALGGTRHVYPATTAVIVAEGGCGRTITWAPLAERRERWEVCVDERGLTVTGYEAFHRFFSQDDLQVYQCEPPMVLVPHEWQPGQQAVGECSTGDLVERTVVEVVGGDTVAVDGIEVAVVRVAYATELTSPDGSTSGSSAGEMAIAPSSGLIIEWREAGESTNSSLVGDVHYDEIFAITLVSLEPRR